MDPNETLTNLKRDAWLLSHLDVVDGSDESLVALCQSVHESVTALDEWLGKGGFLPDAWQQPLVPAFGVNPLVDKMLHEVFVTALEGGIGYWAASSTYHWTTDGLNGEDLEGFYSDVVDAEGEEAFEPVRIDRAVVARGFERIARGPVEYMPEGQRARFVAMLHARLAGQDDRQVDIDYDAGDADNLVQVGLFGTVVFG